MLTSKFHFRFPGSAPLCSPDSGRALYLVSVLSACEDGQVSVLPGNEAPRAYMKISISLSMMNGVSW